MTAYIQYNTNLSQFQILCYTNNITDKQIDIVVVGASHAGISCAINLKKHAQTVLADVKDNDISINIVLLELGDGEGLSFVGADGLLWVSGVIPEKNMCYTTPDKVRAHGIDLRLNHLVNWVDPTQKEIFATITDSGEEVTISYDYLVLATGSRPVIPEFTKRAVSEGYIETEKHEQTVRKPVQTMKDFSDAINLANIRDNDAIRKVGVIGGGYIGVEAAETLKNVGKDVVIFQGAEHLINTYYDAAFSELLEKHMQDHGIELRFNKRFEDFNDPDFADIDAFILAIGFRANTNLAKDLLEIKSNAYFVDKYQRTSINEIYAIGDCSISYNNALQDYQYLAIGSATAIEANIAADAIIREVITSIKANNSEFGDNYLSRIAQQNHGTVGSNALTIYDLNLAGCGLTLEVAEKLGINAKAIDYSGKLLDSVLVNNYTKWVAAKGNELPELKDGELKIRIVYEANTRRVLGFQAASHADPTGFTHFFSLAIAKSLTLDEIKNTDLFFSPLLNQLYNHLTRVLSRI